MEEKEWNERDRLEEMLKHMREAQSQMCLLVREVEFEVLKSECDDLAKAISIAEVYTSSSQQNKISQLAIQENVQEVFQILMLVVQRLEFHLKEGRSEFGGLAQVSLELQKAMLIAHPQVTPSMLNTGSFVTQEGGCQFRDQSNKGEGSL